MEKLSTEQQVVAFMSRTLMIRFEDGVGGDTDLFDVGLIDSYGFVDLVAFIERTFGISLDDDELTSPEMSTLSGIVRLISLKQAAKHRAASEEPV
jgi:D-alanine--poly(phosphoribitol) ligase subunit 2